MQDRGFPDSGLCIDSGMVTGDGGWNRRGGYKDGDERMDCRQLLEENLAGLDVHLCGRVKETIKDSLHLSYRLFLRLY